MEDTFLPKNTDLSVEESHPLASADRAPISVGSDATDVETRWLNNVRDFIVAQSQSNLAHRQLARYCNEIRAKNPKLAKLLPTLAEPVPFREEDAIQTFERWLEELLKLNRAIEQGNIAYIRNHAFRNGARLIRYFRALVRESDDSQFTSGLKADRLELIWKIDDGVARCKLEYQTLIGELERIELRIAQSLRGGNRDMTAHSRAIARALNAYEFVLSDTLKVVMDAELQRIEKRKRFFQGKIEQAVSNKNDWARLRKTLEKKLTRRAMKQSKDMYLSPKGPYLVKEFAEIHKCDPQTIRTAMIIWNEKPKNKKDVNRQFVKRGIGKSRRLVWHTLDRDLAQEFLDDLTRNARMKEGNRL